VTKPFRGTIKIAVLAHSVADLDPDFVGSDTPHAALILKLRSGEDYRTDLSKRQLW
jgi:hypothetical protein